jgi:pyrimidine deaminase RibD-like protein
VDLDEAWSQKYKRSINCSHPKGFSQKAHCAGKKKHNESIEMEMTCPDCGMCETHGDHSKDTLDEACWKGYHKEGMKTMFGKKYPNCVKNKGVSEAGSPAQQAAIAIAMKKAGKKPKHVDEDAAGVGVVATNKKMAKDPRYSTSMTIDVHPDTPKKQLKALRLAEMQASDFEIRNFEKLDTILAELCKQVIAHQKDDADYWGMVAACVVDPDDNVVPGINYLDDSGKRVHAERAAIDSYREHFGEIPEGSIIVTTLSPCCHPLEERYGESCTELINDTDVHKVYCGYKDPTQEQTMNRTFHIMQTRNASIVELCKSFADTFLGKIDEDTKNKHSIDEDEMMTMVREFLPVAMKDLKIKSLPHIVLQPYVEANDGQATFGRFVDAEERIYLGIADRHPVDILRTLAHELVHFKQYEDDKMYPGAGKTGSPIENEAHVVAGIIMRHFNKKYPAAIKSKPLEL